MIELTDADRAEIQRIWHVDHVLLTSALTEAYLSGLSAGIERSAKAAEDCKPMMYRQVPRNMKLGYDEACNNCAAAIRALNASAPAS